MTRAAVFTIPGDGHLRTTLPIATELVRAGVDVDFYAHAPARPLVERTGAHFVDIYDSRDMDVPDATSLPVPMRNVSFAGYWADDIVDQVAGTAPDLILNDTFAVIGRVVAQQLELPRVQLVAGHNLHPDITVAAARRDPQLVVAPECLASAEALASRYGIADASPFSYLHDTTADFVLYPEPPEFLPASMRYPFSDVGFFGSLWEPLLTPKAGPPLFGEDDGGMCVYVGVGTAYWMIDPALAVHTLTVLADALSGRPDTQTVISLGGSPVADELIPILTRPNVEVRGFVDQQAALASADVFVSHNGLNSTHEAVYHLVPMISIPQFGDQHGMARTVTDLGLAIPLGTPFGGAAANAAPGPSFTDADVVRVLDEVAASRSELQQRLRTAREWELDVMARRPEVVQRILEL